MLETPNVIRKNVSIPKACHERYLPLDCPAAQPLVSIGATFAGVSDLVPGYHIGVPSPARVMLIATVSGAGELRTPQTTCSLTAHSLLIAPPVSAWEYRTTGTHWRILWCYFCPGPRWTHLRAAGITCAAPWPPEHLERAMEGFLASVGRGDQQLLYGQLLASLFAEILGEPGPLSEASVEGRLAALFEDIRRNPGLPWTIGGIARDLGMSVSTLQRVAHKVLGTTVWQEVLRIRMQTAQNLLRSTDYPLKVIAERVGYADEFVFSSAFKRHTGISPSLSRT